jgi:pimeloyl-ACP methyl ester carboxylesterase
MWKQRRNFVAAITDSVYEDRHYEESLRRNIMSSINVSRENSGPVDIYYEDHGTGDPVVLIHGWPLSGASWEKQVPVLLDAGYRVITYDRRGFGNSGRPTAGYNYDTFAEDLHKIITKLDLRDAVLVGFSMGGGEVARYLGAYGSGRVKKAVFISSIPPFLLKAPDNPEGVDGAVFDGIKKAIAADRPAFLSRFLSDFYNFDVLGGKLVSEEVVRFSWNVAVGASPKGTLDCVSAWLTDFRKDLAGIDVPTLVIHGDADRILPLQATGKRTAGLVRQSRLVIVEGGPHGITWTHAEKVNSELLNFLGQRVSSAKKFSAAA